MAGDEGIEYPLAMAFLQGNSAEFLLETYSSGLSPEEFFTLSLPELSERLEIPLRGLPDESKRQEALANARRELNFTQVKGIRVIPFATVDYPQRLLRLPDAPLVLFSLGDIDFNDGHWLSIVGTRRCTSYGANFCKRVCEDFSDGCSQTTIVSGLASGIDSCAHSAALDSGLPTVAVLAHGLDMIYPAANRPLAARIVKSGGAVVSEYCHGVHPFKRNFLDRNRIIAGLSDATLVAESDYRGGALSTARKAHVYGRAIFALPGRVNDDESRGCNELIHSGLALPALSGKEMARDLGWWEERSSASRPDAVQKSIFTDLPEEQQSVYEILRMASSPLTADDICTMCGKSVQEVTVLLVEMEFDGKVARRPGNRYELNR